MNYANNMLYFFENMIKILHSILTYLYICIYYNSIG